MLFLCNCTLLEEKNKNTTVVVFLQVKCDRRHLFDKVVSVLGAKKNPTRISKYGSFRTQNDK